MIKRWMAVALLLCMTLNMAAGSLAQVNSAAHSAMHVATNGEADIATDGEADIATDGEADIATDGEADIATDGEADIATDGEATEAPCEHSDAYNPTLVTMNDRYINTGNDAHHKLICDLYSADYCPYCYAVYNYQLVQIDYEEEEEHWLDDEQTCELCGYGSACVHDDVYTGILEDNEKYTQIDDPEHHRKTYDVLTYWKCADCELWLWTDVIERDQQIIEKHSWDKNGLCDCGHVNENACKHETYYIGEYTDHYRYRDKDDMQCHHYVWDTYVQEICSDCDQVLFTAFSGTLGVVSLHQWDDLWVCKECGIKNTCGHSETNSVERHTDRVYEDIDDPMYHRCTYDVYMTDICLDACGAELSRKHLDTVEWNELHNWNAENICTLCGVENLCEHEITKSYYYGYNAKFEKIGNPLYHWAEYEVYKHTDCEVCGWGSAEYDHFVQEYDVHRWDDDETCCIVCWQPKDCTHVNTWKQESYTAEHISIGDNLYHNKVYQFYYNINCDDCGATAIAQEPIGEQIEQYQHEWDANGVCTLCQQENVCQHVNTWQQESYTSTYVSTGDPMYHNRDYVFYYNTNCDDCGAVNVAPQEQFDAYTEQEQHVWNEDGVCRTCEQVNTCAHETMDFTSRTFQTWRYIPIEGNNYEHTYGYDVYAYPLCTTCGLMETEPICVETVVQDWTSSHYWTDDGLCSDCGYVNTCTHLDGYPEYPNYESRDYYEDTGDLRYHNTVMEEYHVYYCTICRMKLEEKLINVRDPYQSRHWWYFDGEQYKCSACNMVNTCAHDVGVDAEISEIWMNHRYENVNDPQQHAFIVDLFHVYYCSGCGMEQYEEYVRTDTTMENHGWNDYDGLMQCWACDAVCMHDGDTYVNTHIDDDSSYERALQADSHYRMNHAIDYVYCDICDAMLSVKPEHIERTLESHSYVDGMCVCGDVEGACDHPNAEQTGGNQKNKIFEKIDDLRHSYSFDVYWEYACPDCGEEYEVYIERGIEDEEHVYQDGMCVICGQACGHKVNGNTWVDYEMVFHDPVDQGDADFHLQPYTTTNIYQCSACQQQYTIESEMEGEEAHTYDENGLCACGATGEPTTCLHENTEGRNFDMNVRYSDVTEEGHTKTADVYYGMWCPDCETYRMRQLDAPDVVTAEEHTFVGSVCACGWENTCEHPNAEQTGGNQKNKVFQVKDETLHTYSFDVYWEYACPDCGENYEVYIERGTEEDVHTFIMDDSHTDCKLCGYVRGTEIVPECRMTLPANLKAIGSQAFANLTAVTHFVVPAGVESIAADAFPAGVTIVALEGSYAAQWAQENGFAFEALSAE